MRHWIVACVLGGMAAAGPAQADEFTDVVGEALAAYGEGDVTGARQELEYALQLLSAMKAQGLAEYLPPAPAGWTKEAAAADTVGAAGAAMAMFGGGTTAAATYRRGTEEFTITLLANSPMVAGIAGMVSGLGAVAGGETRRIQRTQFMVTDGEVQGVVADRILVSASGAAALEDKLAAIDLMDLRALGEF